MINLINLTMKNSLLSILLFLTISPSTLFARELTLKDVTADWNEKTIWSTENGSEAELPSPEDSVVLSGTSKMGIKSGKTTIKDLSIGKNKLDESTLIISEGAELEVLEMIFIGTTSKLTNTLIMSGSLLKTGMTKNSPTWVGSNLKETSNECLLQIESGQNIFNSGITVGSIAPGCLKIVGPKPELIRTQFLNIGIKGTVYFEFGAEGVAPISIEGALVPREGGKIVIDLEKYEGSAKEFKLLSFKTEKEGKAKDLEITFLHETKFKGEAIVTDRDISIQITPKSE